VIIVFLEEGELSFSRSKGRFLGIIKQIRRPFGARIFK